jgi:uncharacterized protein with HEPN domain
MPRDEAALVDIATAADKIREFVQGFDREAFFRDAKTQSAVIHQLLVLGEAVARLSGEIRDQHSNVPWRLIVGMRNKLIHEYNNVDLEEVWKTAREDIPLLLKRLASLLPDGESP